MNRYFLSAGRILSALQSGFVSLLRLWSIPIVLMLTVASGYTTYYGMSRFITDWIALIITVAVQSIIVICSLEIATIHWRANRSRYFLVSIALLASVCVSVTFSYFKFYEISQTETLRIQKLSTLQRSIDEFLDRIYASKTSILAEQRDKLNQAKHDTNLAYMGKHPDMAPGYANLVGKGVFWKYFNDIAKAKKADLAELEAKFITLDQSIGQLRQTVRLLDLDSARSQEEYQVVLTQFSSVQKSFDELVTSQGRRSVSAPILPPYEKFIQTITPSFSMWEGFSWFAFVCAAMVDFFTIILSHRLESNAPGAMTDSEQELAYHCLRQFSEFRINPNDELEISIEKNQIEKARRYPDWMRLFGTAFLLNKGFLRRVNTRSVEFSPNLYSVFAKVMNDQATRTDRVIPPSDQADLGENESFDNIVKRMSRG